MFNSKRSKISMLDWSTCGYHSLPRWLQDNIYIRKGYRPPLKSFWLSFMSIFRIHTETGNIWSHILAFILFNFWLFKLLTEIPHSAKVLDKFFCCLYFCGQIFGALGSVIFHTFECHSRSVSKTTIKIDYFGVFFAIWTANQAAGYFAFRCNDDAKFYWHSFGVVVLIAGTYIIVNEKISKLVRIIIFASAAFPSAAGLLIALSDVIDSSGSVQSIEANHGYITGYLIRYWLLSYLTLGFGAFVYIKRIPEKYFPGLFDYLGQSHQILHVTVIIGVYYNYLLLRHIIKHKLSIEYC